MIFTLQSDICTDTYLFLVFYWPSTMWEQTLYQFKEDTVIGLKSNVYTEQTGSSNGVSRGKKGGMRYISRQPVQIPLVHLDMVDMKVTM